jgi:predicted nucleotidyltransferase
MLKSKLSIEDIQKAVAPVAKKYGVKRVFLFGSYARGDNTNDSDIDLRCEGGDIYGPWLSNNFQDDMRDMLGVKVDVVSVDNPESEFLRRISSDHVLLCERGRGFRKSKIKAMHDHVPHLAEICRQALEQLQQEGD